MKQKRTWMTLAGLCLLLSGYAQASEEEFAPLSAPTSGEFRSPPNDACGMNYTTSGPGRAEGESFESDAGASSNEG